MDYAKKIMYQSNYWYNDGLRKAEIRDMSGAIASLRKSLQCNRENIAARNLLGLVYYGIGEVPRALVEWIISKSLSPKNNIAEYYISRVQSTPNELDSVNQAIKRYNQCLFYCRQNGEDLALIQLKQAIQAHPSFLKAHLLLALIYIHLGQEAKARQELKEAKRLDTGNERILQYTHALTKKRGRKRSTQRPKKKKIDAVEYSVGNETIIQPRHSVIKEMASHLAVANLFIGAVIGAAIVWFLIAPATEQFHSENLNDQMREYSEQINALQAQISAQSRSLENYRAEGEAAQVDAQKSAAKLAEYESLSLLVRQEESGEYRDTVLADSLLKMNRDTFGDSGKAVYDILKEKIFPKACRGFYTEGNNAFYRKNYDEAVTALQKVVTMDATYNYGQALYQLGQAYEGAGDRQKAKECYERLIKEQEGTRAARRAQTALDEMESPGQSGEEPTDGPMGNPAAGTTEE